MYGYILLLHIYKLLLTFVPLEFLTAGKLNVSTLRCDNSWRRSIDAQLKQKIRAIQWFYNDNIFQHVEGG